jgi:hypothetical protein
VPSTLTSSTRHICSSNSRQLISLIERDLTGTKIKNTSEANLKPEE